MEILDCDCLLLRSEDLSREYVHVCMFVCVLGLGKHLASFPGFPLRTSGAHSSSGESLGTRLGNIHCYCEKVHENCPIPCQLFKTSSATFARACVLFALPTLVAIAIATRTLLLTIKTLEGTRNSLGS